MDKFICAVKSPSEALSLLNCAVVSTQSQLLKSKTKYVLINHHFPLKLEASEKLNSTDTGFNGKQREWIGIHDIGQRVHVRPCQVGQYIGTITIELDYYGGKSPHKTRPLDTSELAAAFQDMLSDTCFSEDQKLVLQFPDHIDKCPLLEGTVLQIELIADKKDHEQGISKPYGRLAINSVMTFEKKLGTSLELFGRHSGKSARPAIINPDWDFKTMGIGGLDQFMDIFRRAFTSRLFPAELGAAMGIKHVKGILLYGPPGTGKTLIARKIGKMLFAREPKVISGPEVLNKFVGQSEANIRELFAEAEKEEKEKGILSCLHIIIFDEIDAICKKRGSVTGSTGVNDSVVNQLLAKIDGVNQLNNILLIGMTNRKDLIDGALLRPGRMEVQLEIGLPDQKGRLEILHIHTACLQKNGKLAPDVDLEYLAARTRNFSGAELEGLVRSATSTAMYKLVQTKDKITIDYEETEKLMVTKEDFEFALEHDIKSAFGSDDQLDHYVKNGIIQWGPPVDHVLQLGKLVVKQIQDSDHIFPMLIKGEPGCGKTALAVEIARSSNFPFIKVISSLDMVGYHDSSKCQVIRQVFDDAYKSPLSCIVIDDIEHHLEYVDIGPRFSNIVLQTLTALLHDKPPKSHRLLVLATTSLPDVTLHQLRLLQLFKRQVSVPYLTQGSEVVTVLKNSGIYQPDDFSILKQ